MTVVAEATTDENLEEAAELLVEVVGVDVAVRQLGDDGLHRVVKLAPALSILWPSTSMSTVNRSKTVNFRVFPVQLLHQQIQYKVAARQRRLPCTVKQKNKKVQPFK